MSTEHIKAAAVRAPNGCVFIDYTHYDAYTKAAEYLGVMADDIFALWPEGFVTTMGRFIDRETAYRIAVTAKQHRPAMGKDPTEPWLEYAEVEHDSHYAGASAKPRCANQVAPQRS